MIINEIIDAYNDMRQRFKEEHYIIIVEQDESNDPFYMVVYENYSQYNTAMDFIEHIQDEMLNKEDLEIHREIVII